MSSYPRGGIASAYTPSHMKPDMQRGQLVRAELFLVTSRSSTDHDEGTVRLLVSIPRERSME